MRASGGTRIEWSEIPPEVQTAVGDLCGSPVVEATNQAGGFSPGLAARCRLADGRRVFVKAVSPAQNPQACRIHRREAEIASVLPSSVPAPRLIGVHDDGRWVALVFDDIEGRQPHEPWTIDDLDIVIPALGRFARDMTPTAVTSLQDVTDRHRPVFSGWRRLAGGDGDTGRLSLWAQEHLETLARAEDGWEDAATGSTLLHADLRADNLLVDDAGHLWIVDWPWACRGAAFVDLVFLLPSIGLGGGPAPATVVERHDLFATVDHDALTAVVAAVAGFFTRAAMDPAPDGLPTLRAFQQAQADVAVHWLATLIR